MDYEFFASCLHGAEQALAQELKSFGIQRVRPLGGGVAFFCTAELAMRACLWSRLASRIMLVVGRVNASDANLLYAGVYDLAWEEILPHDASMAVRAQGTNDELRNTRFIALKAKDAIVDRMRSKVGVRPNVDTQSPRASIEVRIRDKRGTVSLDFSGAALNQRTYLAPEDKKDAALECSVCAIALTLGNWNSLSAKTAAFVDPACRDGIMLVEAAWLACDRAPGLQRKKWGFEGWAGYDRTTWQKLLSQADERFKEGLKRLGGSVAPDGLYEQRPNLDIVRFVGTSTSSPSIRRAREHVRHAGVRSIVSIELGDAQSAADVVKRVLKAASRTRSASKISGADVKRVFEGAEVATENDEMAGKDAALAAESAKLAGEDAGHSGLDAGMADALFGEAGKSEGQAFENGDSQKPLRIMVATNIDASSRLDSVAHVSADESAFVAACAASPHNARFVVAGSLDVQARFGAAPCVFQRVGRGRVEATVEVFDCAPCGAHVVEVPDLSGGAAHFVEVLEGSSGQFAARLRKVFKERRKWAAREGISCYRIYDADLPDYAVAIDWYTGDGASRGNNYLHIAEYAPPASVDADKARRRFTDVLSIAPVVCGVRPDHVFSKTRVREKGGGQYRNAGSRAYVTTVAEGDHLFEVDLAGRLDTGLFLDHRLTRAMLQEKAHGARFLNLFAYTGTASVYAACGKAVSTTTIDLSQTYLDWARRNMAMNGFTGSSHVFERADVMRWVTDARRAGKRFDLAFVDPPTFSNSKAMGKRTWDVQRDHVELLIGVSRLLAEGGLGVFSCNLRNFKPALEELQRYGVQLEDITLETIPLDFARTPKIHKCFLFRHA